MTGGSGGQHMRKKPWWLRPTTIGAAAALVVAGGAVGLAVADRGPSPAQKRAHVLAVAEAAAAAHKAASEQLLTAVTVTPASGATSVPLDAAVTVSTTSGALTSVRVTTAAGAALGGSLSLDSQQWTAAAAPLTPATTYTVAVDVVRNGLSASQTYTFATLTPAALVSAAVFPTGGMTVGVGQPLIVHLDHPVTADASRRAIEAAFTVAESQPVPAGWYWFSPTELHLRPQAYWPAHELITVTGSLAGLDLGGGRWGTGSTADSYSIGDARVSYANLGSEQMTVTLDGRTVYSYPISGGRPQYPTMDGDHIVLDRESVVHMVSSTVGIPVKSPNGYDELVYQDVHISDSGEYVHAAPWSVGSQGFTNVSHGCINLSPANAQTFFDFSRIGDVVEVTGSSRPAAVGDHGVMDWSTPWSDWTPAKVVPITAAAPSPGVTPTG